MGIKLGWWLLLQRLKFHLNRNVQKYNQCVHIISIVNLFLYYILSNIMNPLLQSQNIVSLVGRVGVLTPSHYGTFYCSKLQCGTLFINNRHKDFLLLNCPNIIYKFDSPQLMESLSQPDCSLCAIILKFVEILVPHERAMRFLAQVFHSVVLG